jgi:YidC/Oxa1 family membrane protein insertase
MDIRRTILLMIFSFSLLMLWNSWQVHQGNPPLFGAPPPKAAPAATTPPADAGAASSQTGVPTAPAQYQRLAQRQPSLALAQHLPHKHKP